MSAKQRGGAYIVHFAGVPSDAGKMNLAIGYRLLHQRFALLSARQ
jgi:hypothetical protein